MLPQEKEGGASEEDDNPSEHISGLVGLAVIDQRLCVLLANADSQRIDAPLYEI